MKTSFETRVSRMGLSSFVDINIFVMKYFLFSFFIFSIFVESLESKSKKMVRPQKGKFRSTKLFYISGFVACVITVHKSTEVFRDVL